MIRTLIADDSAVTAEFLRHVLGTDPAIEIVGLAVNGEEAVALVAQTKPDVVTMDWHMPRLDGLEATRRIMETRPVPIVIVSASSTAHEAVNAFRAMEAGALAVVSLPFGFGHPEHEITVRELIRTVKLMSEVRLVRRWPRSHALLNNVTVPAVLPKTPVEIRVIALGASTGGPIALQSILSTLPPDFSVPLLIVQHIARGFLPGFAEWLGQRARIPVRIAAHGEALLASHAYLAPDGQHLGIDRSYRIALAAPSSGDAFCPSISHLFGSVARVCGAAAAGVLLTGMGKDGADALKMMRDLGAITIAQDEQSSAVHGMPGEAIKLGAAALILSAGQIGPTLVQLTQRGGAAAKHYATEIPRV